MFELKNLIEIIEKEASKDMPEAYIGTEDKMWKGIEVLCYHWFASMLKMMRERTGSVKLDDFWLLDGDALKSFLRDLDDYLKIYSIERNKFESWFSNFVNSYVFRKSVSVHHPDENINGEIYYQHFYCFFVYRRIN